MTILYAEKLAEKIPVERWIEHKNCDIVYYWTTSNSYGLRRISGLQYGIMDQYQAYWFYLNAVADRTCTWEAYFSGEKGVQYPGSQIEMWARGIIQPPEVNLTLQDIEFLFGH